MSMRCAAAAAALALLAGCSSWFTSSRPKPAELPQLAETREAKVLWTASVSGGERFIFRPAVTADAVYASGRDGTVARFDAATGKEVWRAATGTPLSAGTGAGATTVAVATEEGEVIALDAKDGKERWRARVSSEVLASPAVGSGLVLVRSVDNRVFAFGESDGRRRWVYQRSPSSLIVRAPAGMAMDRETAYVGFSGGKLAALALSNGGVRWEATVSLPKGATELERVTDVVGEPNLQGREVCVASYQGRVACYEAASGRQLWGRELSSLSGVGLDARYAYVTDDKDAVHALDRTNGRSVWKQDRLSVRRVSQPLPVGAVAVVGDFEGYVHFLARETGAFVGRYATGGGAVRAAPVPLGDGFLVQTLNGGLFALAP
ncbi:MAG TPA: outer membrane protein assembly factor BamB [Burkholderiales bacterium]|nr:outer membrane protein assembly factor BamB [Burkholderiales bacterium]